MSKLIIYPIVLPILLLSSSTALAQKANDTLRRKDANGWEFIQVRSYNLVVSEGYLSKGIKEGVWTEYHPTLYPASTITYLHGKKDGIAIKISGAGLVESVENYKDDKLEGPYRVYNNEKAGLREESFYSEGKKHGAYTKWYANGNKQETGTYRYDKREGRSIWYFETGAVAAEYNYRDGEIDGDVSTFYKNGQLSAFGPYKNGVQTGNWKEYHENSSIKAEGIYVNGEKEGEWKNYDDKGKSIKSTTFSKGEVK